MTEKWMERNSFFVAIDLPFPLFFLPLEKEAYNKKKKGNKWRQKN